MLKKSELIYDAGKKMIELFGKEYMREHFLDACHSQAFVKNGFEFFCGFEGNKETNKWTVFARVLVDTETGDTTILDYRLPDGTRMKNPIQKVICA